MAEIQSQTLKAIFSFYSSVTWATANVADNVLYPGGTSPNFQ